MMRIVHVIASLDPATGGPPMVALRLAAAQAHLGHDVYLLSYQNDFDDAQMKTMLKAVPDWQALKLVQIPWPDRHEQLHGTRGAHALASLIHLHCQPIMVHLHGVWESILRASAKVCRRYRVPYAIAPHGMLDPWSLQQRSLKKRLALTLGYRKMLNHAAFLHTLNEDERILLKPLHLRRPCKVIPNGVFLDELKINPKFGSYRLQQPSLGSDPYILFLSRLHYKKGLDFLINAFEIFIKQHATAQLVIAGPDGGMRQPLEQMIQQANLQRRVRVVGPLWGDEKLAALSDAACFCLPSRQEGFSIAVTEALALKTPVIISEACHFPEVKENKAGYVLALDDQLMASSAKYLAATFAAMLSDEQERKKMGEAGAALIKAHYTWPKIAKQAMAFYEKAVPDHLLRSL